MFLERYCVETTTSCWGKMFIVIGNPAIVCVEVIFKLTTILVDFTFG